MGKFEATERLRLALWRIGRELERMQMDAEFTQDPLLIEQFDDILSGIASLQVYIQEGQNANTQTQAD